MSGYNLIVPPKVETQITGFQLAAEKVIRKATWRVEFWAGKAPMFYRDQIPICTVPRHVAAFGDRVREQFIVPLEALGGFR